MNINHRQLLFLIFFIVSTQSYSQTWSDWKNLSVDGVIVDISFKMAYCKTSTSIGRYLDGNSYWRTKNSTFRAESSFEGFFDFIDCNGNTKTQRFSINLSKVGIDENRGAWFSGYEIVRIYGFKLHDYSRKITETNADLSQIKFKIAEGDREMENKNYDEAIKSYEKAIELSPNDYYVLSSKIVKARELKAQAENDRRIEELNKARLKHEEEVRAAEKKKQEALQIEEERINNDVQQNSTQTRQYKSSLDEGISNLSALKDEDVGEGPLTGEFSFSGVYGGYKLSDQYSNILVKTTSQVIGLSAELANHKEGRGFRLKGSWAKGISDQPGIDQTKEEREMESTMYQGIVAYELISDDKDDFGMSFFGEYNSITLTNLASVRDAYKVNQLLGGLSIFYGSLDKKGGILLGGSLKFGGGISAEAFFSARFNMFYIKASYLQYEYSKKNSNDKNSYLTGSSGFNASVGFRLPW